MKDLERQRTASQRAFMTLMKRHRLAKGFTQEKLARKIGVDQSSVSLWESGESLPSPEKFPVLARVLGIDPLELTKVIEPEIKAPATAAG